MTGSADKATSTVIKCTDWPKLKLII